MSAPTPADAQRAEALKDLRVKILEIPVRREWIGGQRANYVQVDEVLGWIDSFLASPAIAPPATLLPDGSAFFMASLPLPKDHWLYAPRAEGWDSERECSPEVPQPILTHAVRAQVQAAIRYAVRAATMQGTDMDFDPDALVQNATYALCGPFGGAQIAAPPAQSAPTLPPGCNRGNLCPWTEESASNGWRSSCRRCGLQASGSGQ